MAGVTRRGSKSICTRRWCCGDGILVKAAHRCRCPRRPFCNKCIRGPPQALLAQGGSAAGHHMAIACTNTSLSVRLAHIFLPLVIDYACKGLIGAACLPCTVFVYADISTHTFPPALSDWQER